MGNYSSSSLSSRTDHNTIISQVDHEDEKIMEQPSTLVAMGFEYRLDRYPRHTSEEEASQESTTNCLDYRLFHVQSETMITPSNREDYIPDGPMFDHVSCLCQEMAQERLQKEHALKIITLCNDTALGEPVRASIKILTRTTRQTTKNRPF
jgi:hypothetical protein